MKREPLWVWSTCYDKLFRNWILWKCTHDDNWNHLVMYSN